MRDLREAHPDLVLSLSEREPWDTVDLVSTGQTDVGVVHSWGDVHLAIPDHLVTTSLADDVADVIVHASHPLATRSRVTPHDLVDEGWIATPEGTICREWLSRMHQGTGRQPRIAHVAMEFQSHLALVRAGLGIALVPRLGREALTDDLVALGPRPGADPRHRRRAPAQHGRLTRACRPWSALSPTTEVTRRCPGAEELPRTEAAGRWSTCGLDLRGGVNQAQTPRRPRTRPTMNSTRAMMARTMRMVHNMLRLRPVGG